MGTTTIEERLSEALKDAMRAKDQRTLDVVRGIKARIQEKRTAPGFKGPADDAVWLDGIAGYKKQMEKALEEFEKVGDRGAQMRDQLRFEIDFCQGYLPTGMSADDIRTAIAAIVTRLGVTGPKQAGRVLGEFMKEHKGKADGKVVREIAEALLAPK